MEYHLYLSDVLRSIKTYYRSFDVPSNESPVDAARRNLLNDISNAAYFDCEYNPVTKNLFITMCIPHAVGGERSRFQYFILSKDVPSDDVEVVENKFLYKVRLMQDDHNKVGAVTYMGVYAEDSEEAVTETIRRLSEHCETYFKGGSYFYKGKLQTNDGEVDIVIEHHVEKRHQKWSVRVYKIEKD